ncbi:MAG: colanic acid biosynthesis glycosyltransferase WcaL, partial [Alphaproteobacteria bacterium]
LPPIVTIFHGHDVGTAHQTGEVGQYQNLFRLGSRHLPVNARFREILIANGAPVERTHVHHMGIDVAAIPFERRDWTLRPLQILSVARLTEKKGISSALMALAKVRGQRPELSWRYNIVGEGELREDLGVLSAELGLTDSVDFLGARPHAEVRLLLAKTQLFLLPSVTAGNGDVEGIPVSLMEAMASGAIVVSSIHSGIPELVEDGVSGLLAPERDVDTLAMKLLATADHPDSMDAMAWNARQTVESEFNATVQMERLETELIATLDEIQAS